MENQNLQDKEKFLDWFSGFTDGEGCFNLNRKDTDTKYHRPRYEPRFLINLRDDDLPMLRVILNTLGFGHIYKEKPQHRVIGSDSKEYVSKPQASFAVTNFKGCLKLVDIFTKHPLRSKKREVFEVWAKAVRECARGRYKNNTLLECYRIEMQELRKYQKSRSVVSDIEDYLNNNRQMEMPIEEVE